MKNISKLLAACALLAGVFVAPAWAQNNPLPELAAGATQQALTQAALKKDAVCTKCHDESETAPVLSIYQTKHGLRGDSRTPTCQSCHGASDKHVLGDPAVGPCCTGHRIQEGRFPRLQCPGAGRSLHRLPQVRQACPLGR